MSRTFDMIQALQSKYGDQCDIKVFTDTNHYCPFSGGGDIRIFKKDSFTGAVLQGPEPQSEELEHASLSLAEIPTSPQLDSQLTHAQKETAVRLQLQYACSCRPT